MVTRPKGTERPPPTTPQIMTKRVVVQMSDESHKALKQYAAFYGMTMSEVMYNCTRFQFHKQMQSCEFVKGMLATLDIPMDKRALKPCYSFLCFSCKHSVTCQTGLYDGVVEMPEDKIEKDLLTDQGKINLTKLQESAGQLPQIMETVKARQ